MSGSTRVDLFRQLHWLPFFTKLRLISLEILKKSLYKYFLESYKDVHHFTIA